MLEDSINYAIALTTLVFRNCECVQSGNWVKRAQYFESVDYVLFGQQN